VNFLDNLRTFLIFLVIILHAGIVYEPILENIWIVSDPVKNSSIGLIRMYLDLFIMATMFFISGYFIRISVQNKSTLEFISSKFKRIMIPWIVAVFTLIPAYKYIFLLSRGMLQEEWYSYFHLFQKAGSDLSFFADNPTQSWLWFLPVLFIFQILYLGLSKTKLLSLKISLKTGVVLTLIIGLVYSLVISKLNITGWFNSPILHFQRERLLVYFMVFLLGALCSKLNVFETEKRNRKFFIVSNVVLTASISIFTVVALNLFFNMIDPGRNYYFISANIDLIAYYLTALLTMLSLLQILIYTFRFNFNKSNSLMIELNKNSYAVYIIHIIVMGLIALVLINVNIPAFFKYLILTTLTFVASNIIASAYSRLFKKLFSKDIIRIAIPVVATVLAIVVYVKQANPSVNQAQEPVSQTEITSTEVGLQMAAMQGNLGAVKQHIKAGSDLDEPEPAGGSSPLITAAVFGQTEAAILLIQAGADVNFKNNEGSTPLHTAAFFCRIEIVKSLLANGADKTIKNNAGSIALESVAGPYEEVKGIYDYFENTLGPLGFNLDHEEIKKFRPEIADILE